jgi:hypothetical protein
LRWFRKDRSHDFAPWQGSAHRRVSGRASRRDSAAHPGAFSCKVHFSLRKGLVSGARGSPSRNLSILGRQKINTSAVDFARGAVLSLREPGMTKSPAAQTRPLEYFREYLRVLARLQIDARLRRTNDQNGGNCGRKSKHSGKEVRSERQRPAPRGPERKRIERGAVKAAGEVQTAKQ